MRSASIINRFVPRFIVCGVVSLVACTSEDPALQNGAGAGGTGGGMPGTGGTAGTGGAGAPSAGTGGTTTGGAAGAVTGGSAGAATGGSAGSVAGASGSGVGGAGTGGAAGSGGAGAGAGGASGTSGTAGTGGAAGSGGVAGGGASGGGAGGASGTSGAAGSGSGAGGSGGGGAFTLTSPNHTEGAAFGPKYTCEMAGFNGSLLPELHWTAGPPGTMSYAITFIDVTLTKQAMPSDLGYHWVIWNIPASTLSLPEAFKDQASIGASENRDYLGPCPNAGGGNANTDTYEFTIYALSSAMTTISPTTGTGAVKDAEMKLEAMNLAKAKLTGTSNASP